MHAVILLAALADRCAASVPRTWIGRLISFTLLAVLTLTTLPLQAQDTSAAESPRVPASESSVFSPSVDAEDVIEPGMERAGGAPPDPATDPEGFLVGLWHGRWLWPVIGWPQFLTDITWEFRSDGTFSTSGTERRLTEGPDLVTQFEGRGIYRATAAEAGQITLTIEGSTNWTDLPREPTLLGPPPRPPRSEGGVGTMTLQIEGPERFRIEGSFGPARLFERL